jgi:hypothetical protein
LASLLSKEMFQSSIRVERQSTSFCHGCVLEAARNPKPLFSSRFDPALLPHKCQSTFQLRAKVYLLSRDLNRLPGGLAPQPTIQFFG